MNAVEARWAAYDAVLARMVGASRGNPAARPMEQSPEVSDRPRPELKAEHTLEHNSRFAIDLDS